VREDHVPEHLLAAAAHAHLVQPLGHLRRGVVAVLRELHEPVEDHLGPLHRRLVAT
jgi:hypothetical protein